MKVEGFRFMSSDAFCSVERPGRQRERGKSALQAEEVLRQHFPRDRILGVCLREVKTKEEEMMVWELL